MPHFLLARLGSGAQLELVETVTPHLKMKQETAETERENVSRDLAAMPAAVLENTPQDDFGLNLANRRCSERRNVSRSLLTAVEKEAGEAELRRSGTGRRNDKASKVVTEPPGGRRRPQGLNRPPDGTGHRQGSRVMKAGSHEPPDKPSRP